MWSPSLRSVLSTSPTALSASFICWVRILSTHFTGTQQTHFEELPASPPSPHSMTHHNDTSTCCKSGNCAAFHAHKLSTWETETLHMFCVMEAQSFSFLGGCSHEACTDSHHTNKCTNPTELCRPCDASVKQDRGGRACLRLRTAGFSLLLHAGWQVVQTSNIFDVCLTEAANRATVQQPLKDVCRPYVGCDVFNICFSSPADTGTLLGQAYFLLFNSVVNILMP